MRLSQLLLLMSSLMSLASCAGIIPGSTKPCKIKKLTVRVTRIMFSVYGDTTEPPVTQVICNYYDPQSKQAKQLGKTNINSNGRSLFPVWNETDGTIESDDNPGLMCVLPLPYSLLPHSPAPLSLSSGRIWRSSSSSCVNPRCAS